MNFNWHRAMANDGKCRFSRHARRGLDLGYSDSSLAGSERGQTARKPRVVRVVHPIEN